MTLSAGAVLLVTLEGWSLWVFVALLAFNFVGYIEGRIVGELRG